ncbi:MAG: GNAT family N-acetyltransferase [Pseudomonadota bacterium]
MKKHNVPVREARPDDAEACSKVLCASIRVLCMADHRGDTVILGKWLANKTPSSLARWIEGTTSKIYVAEIEGQVAGVGGIDHGSEITLNYVSPSFRFHGVSGAILTALEDVVRQRGFDYAALTSTTTAHGFYVHMGWHDAGPPETWLGMQGFPMSKQL